MHGEFDSLWQGPFTIYQIAGENSFWLAYCDGWNTNCATFGMRFMGCWNVVGHIATSIG